MSYPITIVNEDASRVRIVRDAFVSVWRTDGTHVSGPLLREDQMAIENIMHVNMMLGGL